MGEQFYTINFYTQFKSNLRPTTIHSVDNKDVCFIRAQSKPGSQWAPELLPS